MSWRSTATPTDPGTITVEPPDKETANETFKKAFEKFVKNHTKKDENGILRWWCPEVDGTIKGPTGSTSDPFGLPVPEGFSKKWLAAAPKPLKLEGFFVGGGRRIEDPVAAIAAALQDAESAVVKFTWSGEQDKPVPGVALTALEDLTPEDIAPHVEQDQRLTNDLQALVAQPVTVELLRAVLVELRELAELLARPDGPVSVSVIAGVRSDAAASFTGTLEPLQIRALMQRLALHPDADQPTLEALHYLAINMGAC
jgi:hypothetical protein